MTIDRRQFAATAALASAGLPFFGASDQESGPEPSGLVTGKPCPLRHVEIPGFMSKAQLRWHHDSHYGGALKGFRKLDAQVVGDHRTRVAKANSVLLHELYFSNMTPRGGAPGEATRERLKQRFGAVERWIEDFRAAAKSSRGWAVLCWHPVNRKLYNVVSDSHEDGPAWSGVPLAVVDTYEHAYYLDYQNRKGDYVDAFTDHLDWSAVESRLRRCLG